MLRPIQLQKSAPNPSMGVASKAGSVYSECISIVTEER